MKKILLLLAVSLVFFGCGNVFQTEAQETKESIRSIEADTSAADCTDGSKHDMNTVRTYNRYTHTHSGFLCDVKTIDQECADCGYEKTRDNHRRDYGP